MKISRIFFDFRYHFVLSIQFSQKDPWKTFRLPRVFFKDYQYQLIVK